MPPLKKQSLASVVGMNIMLKRQAKGLSQRDFAKMMDMAPDSLSRMERGYVAPRFGRLEKLASLLDCSVAELFMTTNETGCEHAAISPQNEILLLTERLATLVRQFPSAGPVATTVRCNRLRMRRRVKKLEFSTADA